MQKLYMDYTTNVWFVLIIVLQATNVHCAGDDITTALSAVTIIRARCLARCYDLVSQCNLFEYLNDYFTVKVCNSHIVLSNVKRSSESVLYL